MLRPEQGLERARGHPGGGEGETLVFTLKGGKIWRDRGGGRRRYKLDRKCPWLGDEKNGSKRVHCTP